MPPKAVRAGDPPAPACVFYVNCALFFFFFFCLLPFASPGQSGFLWPGEGSVNKTLILTDLLSYFHIYRHMHHSISVHVRLMMRVTTLLVKQSSSKSLGQPSTLVAGLPSGK